jgi:glutathione synthase/RimK-type ligase-like ATP-grasp enzyme
MKIALLTCEALPNLSVSDQLLIPQVAKQNIEAKAVVWNDKTVDWTVFEALIFRNTWDYYEKETEFMAWLDQIEKLGIKTLNSIEIVKKNVHKFYLKTLQQQSITIIPTIFIEKTTALNLSQIIPKHWEKAVIKPAFSAGSYQTKLFEVENIEAINQEYLEIASQKELLLQQYQPEIQTLGETSFIFIDKKFSHCVNKKPKPNDFRVQVQFGGAYVLQKPSTKAIANAQKIINLFPENLLYARVDCILRNDEIHLMEIECIEPDLYFSLAENTTETFVTSISKMLKKQPQKN